MPQGNPFTSAVAPATMAGIAPDLASEQIRVMRQQQLADLLRRQGMEPMGPTEMVGGWAVKKSPLEAVARLAQALGGSYLSSQADERQIALSQALQQRQAAAIDSMLGGSGDGNAAARMVQKWGDENGDSGPPDPALVQQVQQAMPQTPPEVARLRNAAKAAMVMGNTDLANKLIGNLLELTTDQKNWAAQGQDPRQVGLEQQAERRGKAMYKMDPGTTTIDMLTGRREFQPKVGEGIMLNNGVASAVPGYSDAAANIAGTQAGSVSAAQSRYKPIVVPTADGQKMMTEAQVVEQSAGGAPLIDAVIKAESNGNQNAVSPKGAIGLGQIMPKTAAGLGGDPKNPLHNVAMAQTLLDRLQTKYGNDQHALAAYNWGEGNVDKWIKAGADPSKLPAETQKYIATVTRLAGSGKQKESSPGIPLKSTQIPESAAKEQQAIIEKIGTSGSINADLAAIDRQIEAKELQLGPLTNLAGKAKNYLGISDENSRNLASFQSTLEKLRNDSLRLNAGVQTEGDSQRAWNELINNLSDEKLVRQRLQEIQRINERGAQLQQLQLDILRKNFGAAPLDTGRAYRQKPAVGKAAPSVDEILRKYGTD